MKNGKIKKKIFEMKFKIGNPYVEGLHTQNLSEIRDNFFSISKGDPLAFFLLLKSQPEDIDRTIMDINGGIHSLEC